MRPIAAVAARRPPWQNPQRLRQVAGVAGALLLLYLVLVLVALLGGPRLGASFLPLPGGGPDPANPVAGLQPSQPTKNVPTIPGGSSPTPGATLASTPLPPATTPEETTGTGNSVVDSGVKTPSPTEVVKPSQQVVDQYDPTTPVGTKRPPTHTTAPPPDPTTDPPDTTTSPPPTTPDDPPTTPDDPGTQDPDPDPDPPLTLGGLLGGLLHTLGL
ncbi:hypothetical protein [Kribbella sp. NBC_00889]|uniref:hypothetical protein n=1 Tax=Kribbella sp. NBC_00889 TaxID=2975974 RepID=UPI00386A70E5|nr:hypothetical protein OG817_40835 [Kribbella sp. NBC_00889]